MNRKEVVKKIFSIIDFYIAGNRVTYKSWLKSDRKKINKLIKEFEDFCRDDKYELERKE